MPSPNPSIKRLRVTSLPPMETCQQLVPRPLSGRVVGRREDPTTLMMDATTEIAWNTLAELRKEIVEAQRISAQVIGFKITFVSASIGMLDGLRGSHFGRSS